MDSNEIARAADEALNRAQRAVTLLAAAVLYEAGADTRDDLVTGARTLLGDARMALDFAGIEAAPTPEPYPAVGSYVRFPFQGMTLTGTTVTPGVTTPDAKVGVDVMIGGQTVRLYPTAANIEVLRGPDGE